MMNNPLSEDSERGMGDEVHRRLFLHPCDDTIATKMSRTGWAVAAAMPLPRPDLAESPKNV